MSKEKQTAGPLTILRLDIFDAGFKMDDVSWQHVRDTIDGGCGSGELCLFDGRRDDQGRGWWTYSEVDRDEDKLHAAGSVLVCPGNP